MKAGIADVVSGSVAYTIDSTKLGRGNHQVTLSSMLLTLSADFRTH